MDQEHRDKVASPLDVVSGHHAKMMWAPRDQPATAQHSAARSSSISPLASIASLWRSGARLRAPPAVAAERRYSLMMSSTLTTATHRSACTAALHLCNARALAGDGRRVLDLPRRQGRHGERAAVALQVPAQGAPALYGEVAAAAGRARRGDAVQVRGPPARRCRASGHVDRWASARRAEQRRSAAAAAVAAAPTHHREELGWGCATQQRLAICSRSTRTHATSTLARSTQRSWLAPHRGPRLVRAGSAAACWPTGRRR